MELSSLIELFLGSELEKFLSNRKDLNIGDKLQGKVIEIKEDGNVLIDFLKFRTIANVKFPVKVGERINVTVIEKGENLKFSLENKNSNITISSKEILNSIKNRDIGDIKKLIMLLNGVKLEVPDKVQDIVKVLDAQFKSFGPAEDILNIATRLKAQIENSGLFFEKKIASFLSKIETVSDLINSKTNVINESELKAIIKNDLKPNLLILKEFFANEMTESGGKQKQISAMRETIDELINNIAKQQEGAVKKSTSADTMQYFTFQIPIKDKGKAKLRVYYNKNDKRDPFARGFNLSLLLIMENLGEIRTDFFLLKKDLNVTFYVMDEDIKNHVLEKLETIREPLVNLFRFLNMSVIVSKRKIREFDNEEIKGDEIKMGLVDLSV